MALLLVTAPLSPGACRRRLRLGGVVQRRPQAALPGQRAAGAAAERRRGDPRRAGGRAVLAPGHAAAGQHERQRAPALGAQRPARRPAARRSRATALRAGARRPRGRSRVGRRLQPALAARRRAGARERGPPRHAHRSGVHAAAGGRAADDLRHRRAGHRPAAWSATPKASPPCRSMPPALALAGTRCPKARPCWPSRPWPSSAESLLGRRVPIVKPAERWLQASRSPWDLAQFDLASTGRARASKKLGAIWRAAVARPRMARRALGRAWCWCWRSSSASTPGPGRSAARSTPSAAAVNNILTQTFPSVQLVVDAPVQMVREVAALQQATGGVSAIDLEPMLGARRRQPAAGPRAQRHRLHRRPAAPARAGPAAVGGRQRRGHPVGARLQRPQRGRPAAGPGGGTAMNWIETLEARWQAWWPELEPREQRTDRRGGRAGRCWPCCGGWRWPRPCARCPRRRRSTPGSTPSCSR